MQSIDRIKSGGRRLKDRLVRLLRPASSLLRSPCSSSTSTTFIATAATTTSWSSSSTTTAALLPHAGPFSLALDLLRHPPIQERKKSSKQRCSSSSGHPRRRRLKNAFDKGVRKLSFDPYGFTTDDDDDGSDDDTVAFSSRTLDSSDSSSVFYTSKRVPKNKNRRLRHRRQRQPQRRRATSCAGSSCTGRVDDETEFRPLVTTAEEEVRKGLAVVKRSKDPYGDFRESMVEMIVERQVFGAAELEQLLQSYLSLNAPRLHRVILQAFSDIWVVLHGGL